PRAAALLCFYLGFTPAHARHAPPPSGTSRPLTDIRKCSSTAGSTTPRRARHALRRAAPALRPTVNQVRSNDVIDLHTHSTASDGSDTPAGLVALAGPAGLPAVALTDHDPGRWRVGRAAPRGRHPAPQGLCGLGPGGLRRVAGQGEAGLSRPGAAPARRGDRPGPCRGGGGGAGPSDVARLRRSDPGGLRRRP